LQNQRFHILWHCGRNGLYPLIKRYDRPRALGLPLSIIVNTFLEATSLRRLLKVISLKSPWRDLSNEVV
jgi:hypothetical protein